MILAMLTSFPLKRSIATLLPVSVLWMFVACVSMCARESGEKQVGNPGSLSTEVKDASDCDGCPLTRFPKATIPERTISGFDRPPLVVIPSLSLSIDSAVDEVAFASRERQRSFADPPLKRLPALRI
jgi:hypothetical protein